MVLHISGVGRCRQGPVPGIGVTRGSNGFRGVVLMYTENEAFAYSTHAYLVPSTRLPVGWNEGTGAWGNRQSENYVLHDTQSMPQYLQDHNTH